jgi:hypothetical protein
MNDEVVAPLDFEPPGVAGSPASRPTPEPTLDAGADPRQVAGQQLTDLARALKAAGGAASAEPPRHAVGSPAKATRPRGKPYWGLLWIGQSFTSKRELR